MHVVPHRQAGCRARAPPEDVRPLVVLYMGPADGLAPPRGQAQVHQEQALLLGRVGLPQQEVLRLHIAVHIPVASILIRISAPTLGSHML